VPRIGRVKPLLESLPTVVIDHHPPGDAAIGGVSFRDPDACAAGELVYDLVLRAGSDLSRTVLDGLYVALLTDTGGFQFSNSTPACHRISADLIEQGADPEALYRRVYGSTPLKSLLLLGASLSELQVDPDGRVAWMTVPRSVFDELGATPENLEGMANYPRSVQGVEVGLVFTQTDDGSTKISFRSNGELDVNALARDFGGGGHVKAAGARVTRPLAEVREEVLRATREALDRMGGE
jgi:phosphoesterase RecJ-like protein